MGTLLEKDNKTETTKRFKPPKKYKVLFHNDDFTPFEFVETLLEKIFHKRAEEATQITQSINNNGVGVAGIYTKEIAETKIAQCNSEISETEYPLLVSMEPE